MADLNQGVSEEEIAERNGSSQSRKNSELPENCVEVRDLELEDGSRYTGQIDKASQLKQGQGTQIWIDGARYVGQWNEGRACGQGTFYHTNGDIFKGEFQNDKANGFGKYEHKSGQTYEGDWVEDLQEGRGKETLADGSFYEG